VIEHQFASIHYRLPLSIEQMEDGSYMATSPALNGFLVLADTIEEVYQLAPDIAKTLLEAIRDKGLKFSNMERHDVDPRNSEPDFG